MGESTVRIPLDGMGEFALNDILAQMDTTSPTVQVGFSLDVGPGRLDASAVVPAGETNLTQLLPVLQDLSSSIIGSAVQIAESEGYSVSCRAGCAACCRQLIPLSIFEAELLAGWISTLPPSARPSLPRGSTPRSSGSTIRTYWAAWILRCGPPAAAPKRRRWPSSISASGSIARFSKMRCAASTPSVRSVAENTL